MRAFAVLMMVQGHTIDTLLADNFRSFDSPLYSFWFTFRGFTAPIFMFSAGVAFTYLLRLDNLPFFENPRVKKGLKRFVTLVLIGYMLRFPTYSIFDYSEVTHAQWLTFFTVDALHLIGFGILFIIILSFFAERFEVSDNAIFSLGAFLFFGLHTYFEHINWAAYVPEPIAAYFYQGTGSLFPLFPWTGYVLAGAVLGSYLARNPDAFSKKSFGFGLIGIATGFILTSVLVYEFESRFYGSKQFWTDTTALIFYRVGAVLLLNGIMALIALRLKSIPDLIKHLGRNTLVIYAVHVVILYGSAWLPGLYYLYAHAFNGTVSALAAIGMIVLMTGMVIGIEKIKLYRKRKLFTAEA